MELSVIIVNYNVKYFLEQCLCSVQKAIASSGIDAEVIVIDNHSHDNSIGYLTPFFPCVKFIANDENIGFTRACNQGYKLSTGKYVLFLNPDTHRSGGLVFQNASSFLRQMKMPALLALKCLMVMGGF